MILSIVCAVAAAATGAACQDQQQTLGPRPVLASIVVDSSLIPAADAYLKAGSGANTNFGSDTLLQVMAGPQRTLVRFDQAQIATAIGADSLVSATLQLTIVTIGNWDGSGSLSLHRMARSWTEAGATWNCSIDTNPANGSADCNEAGQWPMGNPGSSDPYLSSATSTITVNNNQTGVLQFDVTVDVRAFLAGTTNNGWLIKKNDGYEGFAHFRSKETSTKPRLVLSLFQGDTTRPAVPTSYHPPADSSKLIIGAGSNSNVYYRHIIEVRFEDSTSGTRIHALLSKYGATIIGGRPFRQSYLLQIPDPVTRGGWDSVRTSVALESGVRYVLPVLFRTGPGAIAPEGRYPTDGSQSTRSNWFSSPTNATRALLAIRAPLAWGCETGAYGASGVDVGVVDIVLDSAHPDIQPNLASFHGLPDSVLKYRDDSLFHSASINAVKDRHHGTNVSASLAAVGDDSIGTTGMLWKTRLHFFSLAKADSLPLEPAAYFEYVLTAASAAGVRVLNVSLDIRPLEIADTAFATSISDRISEFVMSGPGRVLVIAMGNETRNATRASWEEPIVGSPTLIKAAVARLVPNSVARSRVLLVAGTTQAGSFASTFSNFMRDGETDIAAPATNILLLANRAETSDELVQYSGTSYGAPLVAGVAGLLWSMDSTLTAQQVRDYIIRGAQEPRGDSMTGALVARVNVPNAPETIYELDAYGSLALLAREHSGLPICGYSADLISPDTLSQLDRVLLRRPQSAGDQLEIPGAGTSFDLFGLSIAQGGRVLALHTRYAASSFRTLFVDQAGHTADSSFEGVRHFLERDTVDVEWPVDVNSGKPLLHLHLDTVPNGGDIIGAEVGSDSVYESDVAVSPSAEYAAAFAVTIASVDSCGVNNRVRRWVVNLHTLQVAQVVTDTTENACDLSRNERHQGIAWAQDSRSATFLKRVTTSGVSSTVIMRWRDGSSQINRWTVSGVFLSSPTVSGDGSLLSVQAWDLSTARCYFEWRAFGTPTDLVGSPTPVPLDQLRCMGLRGIRSEANLRAALTTRHNRRTMGRL